MAILGDDEYLWPGAINIDGPEVFAVLDRILELTGHFAPLAGHAARVITKRSDEGLATTVRRLYATHERQWDFEDLCRGEISDSERGRLKREIDESNAKRIQLINQIDATFAMPSVVLPAAILWPATVGQTVDALLVQLVKAENLSHLENVALALSHGIRSTHQLANLIKEGRVVLPPFSTIKNYGNARENRLS